jgi:hypothetical protein
MTVMTTHEKITQRYFNAIEKLKELCEKEVAIKTSYFCNDMKINTSFFSVLLKLNAIQKVISEHKEGTIFKFTYKRAENESIHFLSTRVCDCISTYQKIHHQDRIKQQQQKEQQTKIDIANQRIAQSQKNTVNTVQTASVEVNTHETTLNKQTAMMFLIITAQQELIALQEQRDAFVEQIQAMNKAIEKKQTYIDVLSEI